MGYPKKDPSPGQLYPKYVDDPVGFAEDILGIGLWSKQIEMLNLVAANDRIAVRAGRKVSKSLSLAVAALWWACTRENARVIASAPTGRQVRNIWYREIRKLYRNANDDLGGQMFEMPDRGIQWPDEREIVGFSTGEAERLAGYSGENLFFIVDEASGVEDEIFETIEGNLAAGGKLLIASNPTKVSGVLYNAFNDKKHRWAGMHMSSEDSPNITGETWISGLATKPWIDRNVEDWGEESAWVQIHIRGQFPSEASNCIIGLELVEEAKKRYEEWAKTKIDPPDSLRVGVDPARFGDDESVVFAVRGFVPYGPYVFRGLDTMALADKVREICTDLRRDGETPVVIVDEIGVGAGVVDSLRRSIDLSVRGLNVAETSRLEQYERKRDQMWFGLRNWLRLGGMLPNDTKLCGELIAPTYSFTDGGRMRVESKDELKARLGRSPDRSDSLGAACFSDIGMAPRLNGPIGIGRRRM